MELSKRLQTIADMVTPGLSVADVGCDHGFVSLYLYEKQISPKVIAMDLRSGPLERAKMHIAEYGYDAYIETRLSDGVSALKAGECDAAICAGMGGRLMAKILSDGYDKIALMQELVLQPQSELSFFRQFLRNHNLHIIKEDMVKEEGKYYPVIKAVPQKTETVQKAGAPFPERIADAFGPCLLAEKNPVLKEFLEMLNIREREILQQIQTKEKKGATERNALRIQALEKEIEDIVYGLSLYGEK